MSEMAKANDTGREAVYFAARNERIAQHADALSVLAKQILAQPLGREVTKRLPLLEPYKGYADVGTVPVEIGGASLDTQTLLKHLYALTGARPGETSMSQIFDDDNDAVIYISEVPVGDEGARFEERTTYVETDEGFVASSFALVLAREAIATTE